MTPHELLAWKSFLRRAALRYGPYGEFWSNNPELTPEPIRHWEIWNEPNIVTFGSADPEGFAKLVRASGQVLHRLDPGSKVILGGLFGRPLQVPPNMHPGQFLSRLYRTGDVKQWFDGVGLHPYVAGAAAMRGQITNLRRVMDVHNDASTPIYVTELGWGSDSYESRWERGLYGQASQLSLAFSMLVEPPRQLADRRGLVVLLGRRRRAHLPVLRLRRPAHRQSRSEAVLVPVQRLDRGGPRSRPPRRVRTRAVRLGTGIAFLGHRVAHTLLR